MMRECCTDHNGEPKKKYPIKEDALEAARHIEIEKGIIVDVYKCESGDGWHLTSQNVRQQPRALSQRQTENKKRKISKTTIDKSLGKDFVEKIKDKVHKHNVEKLEEKGNRKICLCYEKTKTPINYPSLK